MATAPACAINFGHVVEFSMQLARFRADGEWGTSLQTKAKTNLIPSATGKLGIGIAGGTLHDLVTGETTGLYGYVPFTYGVTDELKLLVNAGLLHDRVLDQTFFTYGAGFEWNFVKPLTLIAEVFGQIGPTDRSALDQSSTFPGRPALHAGGIARHRYHLRPQHHGRKYELDHARAQRALSAVREKIAFLLARRA